jgi:AmmeMemoRadiSam system protein A
LEADLPLFRGVQEMAVKAAVADPRFEPMSADELPGVRIEISVLTRPRQIKGIEDVEIGRDGLLIEHRGRRGVLLPKVAKMRHWNRRQFLQHLCQKAGLPADSWTGDARLYTFTAFDFAEED